MKPTRQIDVLNRPHWAYKPSAQTDVAATFAALIKAQKKPVAPGNVVTIAKKKG